jgi:fructosamine-3-kinase
VNPFYRAIAHAISAASGQSFDIQSIAHIGGGCINETVKLLGTDGTASFLKSNTSADTSMFAAEFDGLKALAATNTLRVPQPLCFGEAEGQAWFVMEFLPLSGTRAGSQEELGRQLAELHRTPQSHFGWHRDNTVGGTPQRNPRADDWIEFWREHRLGCQLELARQRGASFPGVDQLLDRLHEFFTDYDAQPSLLHGDLWSGNVGFLADGPPVVFDPACYFGDREAEFGIIEMFGGFTAEFYRGYHSVWPLDQGFQRRLPLYELYHALNHFNLFGASYAASCQRLIDQLLSGIE